MSNRNALTEEQKAAAIRGDIERTRAEMTRTVDEIEHRLSPAHLKEQVADLKDTVVDQFHQAKEQIKEDLKADLLEAKGKVTEEIAEVKVKVRDEIADVKTAAYDATVGKVSHMVGDARETMTHMASGARESVTTAGTSVFSTIRANPIPAAMIAVGLGWLLMGARTRRYDRIRYAQPYGGEELDLYAGYVGDTNIGYEGYIAGSDMVETGLEGDREMGRQGKLRRGREAVANVAGNVRGGVSNVGHRVGDGVSNVRHRVADGASHLAENVSGAAHRVGDRAGHLVHDARGRAMRVAGDARDMSRRVARGAGQQFHRAEATMEVAFGDNPLAFGAVAFAAGAAVGLALPHTAREDQLMGEVKDQLFEKAQLAAREALHQAEEKVGHVASVAGQTQSALQKAESAFGGDTHGGKRIGGLEGEVKSSIGKQI